MTTLFKQTWWDNNLNNSQKFGEYIGWLGNESADSRVFIRENIKDLEGAGMGLEESILASGRVAGNIDADFLEPVAGKRAFKEDRNWQEFLIEIDKLIPGIEAEIKRFEQAEAEKKLSKVYDEANQLVREVLESSDFSGLEFLHGIRKIAEPKKPEAGLTTVLLFTIRVRT